MIKKFLDLIFGKSVYEQESDYIKKHGYPKQTVVFVDSQGRMSQIIGSDTILKNCEMAKHIMK